MTMPGRYVIVCESCETQWAGLRLGPDEDGGPADHVLAACESCKSFVVAEHVRSRPVLLALSKKSSKTHNVLRRSRLAAKGRLEENLRQLMHQTNQEEFENEEQRLRLIRAAADLQERIDRVDFSEADAMGARAENTAARAKKAPTNERGPACLECGGNVTPLEAAPGLSFDCPACGEIIGAKLWLEA